jgi:hypothetical protein
MLLPNWIQLGYFYFSSDYSPHFDDSMHIFATSWPGCTLGGPSITGTGKTGAKHHAALVTGGPARVEKW